MFSSDQYLIKAALFHDIGKANSEFQKRVNGCTDINFKYWSTPFEKGSHALPSAFFILLLGKEENNFKSGILASSHHAGLRRGIIGMANILEEMSKISEVLKQFSLFLQDRYVDNIIFSLNLDINRENNENEFIDSWQKIKDTWKNSDLFSLYSKLYHDLSLLVLGDRLSAADLFSDQIINFIFSNRLNVENKDILQLHLELTKNFEKTRLNEWRSYIQKDLIEAIKGDEQIIILNIPTGGGKTLASFLIGLKLAKMNNLGRIIYMLPYTSIIDQTAKFLSDILSDISLKTSEEDIDILVDHYLSQKNQKKTFEEHSLDELGDMWNYPIIVTTYVKLWNMLVLHEKDGLLRFPFVPNSIIIFDEIQYIHYKHKKILLEVIEFLIKMGCRIIISTAVKLLCVSSKIK